MSWIVLVHRTSTKANTFASTNMCYEPPHMPVLVLPSPRPLSVHDSGCTRHPDSGDVLVDRWAMEYWNDPKTFRHIGWRWLRCIVYVLHTWSWWSSDIWSVRYFFNHFETFQARLLLELQEEYFVPLEHTIWIQQAGFPSWATITSFKTESYHYK